ncbi:MAG: 16S rRNA (uracil(1498)-N(3))-methyltransferase [Firmicutes bacterium HGW-Firmicutes-14]|nr:MAG: 16S rRNA (uracil(1498)-N(3))-methyltransferase [Firmicutes bacterium HGW-Firmicutes-14]
MARFFVPESSIKGDQVVITGPDVKHIGRVLRLGPGDEIVLSPGNGRRFLTRISEITSREVLCKIISEQEVLTEPPVRVSLYQGLPKGEKMELVIQKTTELGVGRIVPVDCERTVVRLDRKKAAARQARWQRVAEEAAKQSGRTVVPQVSEPVGFETALAGLPAGCLALMPWEEESLTGIRTVLQGNTNAVEIAVFIGPEGGFSRREAELARVRRVIPVSIGPRIMRTETAGIAAVAVIMYELGDLGGLVNG